MKQPPDSPYEYKYRSWHNAPNDIDELRRHLGVRSYNQLFDLLVTRAQAAMTKSKRARTALENGDK